MKIPVVLFPEVPYKTVAHMFAGPDDGVFRMGYRRWQLGSRCSKQLS